MHMRKLVQLAMSGVLVLGSFAFAEEPDWTGRSQQEREADSSDSRHSNPEESTEQQGSVPDRGEMTP
ncbi:hypothetical protein FHS76_004093 [Ochrobactrum daejeonense]|uniref:Secreted protein n=1 Tax=Brucella daejeonensis TaxID=659015 RepID=A0A7W9B0V9_9HYPH|nr:hypothetical protein [Brucella daejeonensis]